MAFIPVWSGCFTGCLAITPNAFLSMGSDSFVSMGPFPSMGWPRGFTTLPSIPSPTGTSTTLSVLLARSPSFTLRLSPKRTKPTLSFSKFNAMPNTPFGNSTNSELMTFSNPLTRATPSPISMTSPTSDTSTETLNASICLRNNSLIFSVFISMILPCY